MMLATRDPKAKVKYSARQFVLGVEVGESAFAPRHFQEINTSTQDDGDNADQRGAC